MLLNNFLVYEKVRASNQHPPLKQIKLKINNHFNFDLKTKITNFKEQFLKNKQNLTSYVSRNKHLGYSIYVKNKT